jgi:hypothetical protein
MLVNVLDLRERSYRWKSVLAVLESAAKNNEAEDADHVQEDVGVLIDYAERRGISVRDAMVWAERMSGPVTLYLYDEDEEGE